MNFTYPGEGLYLTKELKNFYQNYMVKDVDQLETFWKNKSGQSNIDFLVTTQVNNDFAYLHGTNWGGQFIREIIYPKLKINDLGDISIDGAQKFLQKTTRPFFYISAQINTSIAFKNSCILDNDSLQGLNFDNIQKYSQKITKNLKDECVIRIDAKIFEEKDIPFTSAPGMGHIKIEQLAALMKLISKKFKIKGIELSELTNIKPLNEVPMYIQPETAKLYLHQLCQLVIELIDEE